MLQNQIFARMLDTVKSVFPGASIISKDAMNVGIKLFTDNNISVGIFNCQRQQQSYFFQYAQWGILTPDQFIGLPLLFKLHSHIYDEDALSAQLAVLHELLLETQQKSR